MFFCPLIFLIEGYLFYRISWFSVIHQQESAIGTPMSRPSRTSLPFPSPSHPARSSQGPCLSSLSHMANSHWLSVYICSCICTHVTLSIYLKQLCVFSCPRLPFSPFMLFATSCEPETPLRETSIAE